MKQFLERASYTWSNDSIRFINTPTTSARQKYFFVQEVGYFKTIPPYFTERENLDSYLIVYTLSGKGILRYLDAEYEILPGSIFYINCNHHHWYSCAQDSEWEFLWLHFNGATALGYYEEFVATRFSPVFLEDTFFVERTLRRVLSLCQKKDLHSELISSTAILNLITELLITNSTEGLSLSTTPDFIKKLLKRLENHFTESLSLDELSRDAGVSKYHLSREFKKYIGTTISEYIISLRLNYAKELLKYSQESVNDITYSCGFNQCSYFIAQFKSREGITPLMYRKKWGD